MEVAFPINKLIKLGLTPDEFSICKLLDEGKTGLLRELAKLKGDSFNDNIKKLNDLGYINYNTIGNIIEIKNLTITKEFKKLVSFSDPFTELYNNFPVSVIRPEGKRDQLRVLKRKCNVLYMKVLKSNPLLHDHILACLEYEKQDKQKTGHMGYFKRLYNWIETREWEKYEDKLNEFTNATISQL